MSNASRRRNRALHDPATSRSPIGPVSDDPARRHRKRRWAVTGFVASSVAQVLLTVIGLVFFFGDGAAASVRVLIVWSLLGTAYISAVAAVIAGSARHEQRGPLEHNGFELGRPARIIASSGTILASLVGAGAAIQLGVNRADPVYGVATTLFGIWAMLLAWVLFQWGFTQLYFLQYYSSFRRILEFPETDYPRMVEFAYFAFTIATTFAASDVNVITSAARWRVTAHSVLSFFFNGLIIVFAFTTIVNPAP